MNYITCVPAYGRDYKSKAELISDWNAGKDFVVQSLYESGAVNKDNKPQGVTLNIRYKKLTLVCVIK